MTERTSPTLGKDSHHEGHEGYRGFVGFLCGLSVLRGEQKAGERMVRMILMGEGQESVHGLD